MMNNGAILAELSRTSTPPLSASLRKRTLALARGNLAARGRHPRLLALADATPPLYLVPSLLISAAAVFILEVFLKAARHFWLS